MLCKYLLTLWLTVYGIRDTKGTFLAKLGSIKDRNGMDLTEAEDIKKRWQEYTELYKKDLHNPDNHNGVITDLEPDILECEVKWALESITTNKASGGDGKIPWRRKWQSTPVLLPGKSHGQRSLVGYSLWGHRESDTTERLNVQIRNLGLIDTIIYKLVKQRSTV